MSKLTFLWWLLTQQSHSGSLPSRITRVGWDCHRPSAATCAFPSRAILHIPASHPSTWIAPTLSSSFETNHLTPFKKMWEVEDTERQSPMVPGNWLPWRCGRQPCPLAFERRNVDSRNGQGICRILRPGIQRASPLLWTPWRIQCTTDQSSIEILLSVPLQNVMNNHHFLQPNP